MPFANPRGALQTLENVPVICSHCGTERELLSPNDAIRDALVDASYVRDFQQELALLKRTQVLFERFPKSCHPIKINHEYIKGDKQTPHRAKGNLLEEDAGFLQALSEDAELNEFLKRSGFLLPARLNFVSEAYMNWQKQLDDSKIKCEACDNGHYVIEEELFKQLV